MRRDVSETVPPVWQISRAVHTSVADLLITLAIAGAGIIARVCS